MPLHIDPLERIEQCQARFEALEPSIQSCLPEEGRFDRLKREARSLCEQHPAPDRRPPLFGLLVGIKDIFHVDGYPTRAGSQLPPSALRGSEAESVSRLKRAGALILGKTVTTEFAHFMPGPTRNPHNIAHTPGGSSSGSAAAVAAGFCDLALGTQTIGSIIRPAAFCGVAGLKPGFDRISTRGVIPLAPSLDHVGCLAAGIEMAARAARVLYATWIEPPPRVRQPVLAIPRGPYLERVPADTMEWFEIVCRALTDAGYQLQSTPVLARFDEDCERHHFILAAEAARAHAVWFEKYEHLYGAKTADLIRRGQAIGDDELEAALVDRVAFRCELLQAMSDSDIDAWICPSTLGPAPMGLESTGDPVMNLPWTHAGFPAVNLPAGRSRTGLPMGLQLVGQPDGDEYLLACAQEMEHVTRRL